MASTQRNRYNSFADSVAAAKSINSTRQQPALTPPRTPTAIHDSDKRQYRAKIMDSKKKVKGTKCAKWQRLIALIMAPLVVAMSMPLPAIAQTINIPQPPHAEFVS